MPAPGVSTLIWDAADQVGSGLICGENIDAGAPCFIASDGLVYMSGGSGVAATTDAGAKVHGWSTVPAMVAQGDAITIVTDLDFGYSTGLTPGISLYVDISTAAKGRLTSTQPVAGLPPCAFTIDDTRVRGMQSLPYPLS